MRKKTVTSSLMRSHIKKTKNLPSRPCYDPFIGEVIRFNENGRCLVKRHGIWQTLVIKKR